MILFYENVKYFSLQNQSGLTGRKASAARRVKVDPGQILGPVSVVTARAPLKKLSTATIVDVEVRLQLD